MNARPALPGVLLALAVSAAPAAPPASVGEVLRVRGEVLYSPAPGEPCGEVEAKTALAAGGTLVALDDSEAVLALRGKEVTLADNASLKLTAAAGDGEYSTVTGVRAPVLFLFPTGRSPEIVGGDARLTFGVNHDLEKIRGLKDFRVLGLHEDAEDELDPDADDAATVDAAVEVAAFTARDDPPEDGYTWYDVPVSSGFTAPGEYTVFVVADREDGPVRLGQSTLLVVEELE